jgi:hypothetical protein
MPEIFNERIFKNIQFMIDPSPDFSGDNGEILKKRKLE